MKSSPAPVKAFQLTVPPEQNKKRLDLFLTSQLPEFSRTQVQNLIVKLCVEPVFFVKALKPSLVVFEGQIFKVTLPAAEETHLPAQPMDLKLVFEDDDVLVINKPVGMVVHPGAGNPDQTLINALVAHCPDILGVGGVMRPGLVHRLDKDTSGLLVVAKSDIAFKSLVRQLKTRILSRQYLALVAGRLSAAGTIDAPIGRHPNARKKMAVRVESGKPAITHFVSLQSNEKASFLLVKLETGRTHQIRAHMSFIKHPVLGDSVYGGGSDLASRQMLHAFRLCFKHPKTGRVKNFLINPPEDFIHCLKNAGFKVPKWVQIKWND